MNEKEILELAQKARDLAAKRKELMDKIQPILNECSDLQVSWQQCIDTIKNACCSDDDKG